MQPRNRNSYHLLLTQAVTQGQIEFIKTEIRSKEHANESWFYAFGSLLNAGADPAPAIRSVYTERDLAAFAKELSQ